MLEMREVEAFLAVAEELHFGRAASKLRVTTSNVSQTIRVLERRIGGELFERTSRVVRLTSLGKTLLAEWQPAYQQITSGMRTAQHTAAGLPPVLRVGHSASLLPGMPKALADAYEKAHPGTRTLWVEVNFEEMCVWDGHDDAEFDVIVGWLPPGQTGPVNANLRSGPPIRRSMPALFMLADHPLAGRASVDIEELADHDVIWPAAAEAGGIEWVPATTPSGRPVRRIRREGRHVESIVTAIEDGNLLHITIAAIADVAWNWVFKGAAIVPLTGRRPFALRTLWPASRETPAITGFAETSARAGADLGWLRVPDRPSSPADYLLARSAR